MNWNLFLAGLIFGIWGTIAVHKWASRKKPEGDVIKMRELVPEEGGYITWHDANGKPNKRCTIIKHLAFGRVRVKWETL